MTKNKKITYSIIGLIVLGIAAFIVFGPKPAAYTLAEAPRPFKGRSDATVVIDEYSDFQCPACRAAVPFVASLDEKYGANIRINYKYFPLETIHVNSLISAQAAACSNDQGKFWEMHDKLFANQANLGKADLESYAQQLGMNVEQFSSCLYYKSRLNVVRADQADGEKLGINSTPSFVLNGKELISLNSLEAKIREALGLPVEVK